MGVKQGDAIFPLLSYVFYDALLLSITKQFKEYAISEKVYDHLNEQKEKQTISVSITAMAYMDNTIWIAESKTQIEEILSKVYNFMVMMGN